MISTPLAYPEDGEDMEEYVGYVIDKYYSVLFKHDTLVKWHSKKR